MTRVTSKNLQTIAICLAVTATLPVGIFLAFGALMSRFITKDNAGIVFNEFQSALDGGVIVHDGIAASDVALKAYWKKTQAIPLDGWGHQVRVSAVVQGSDCEMTIVSAGPDGAFGTGDDLSIQRSFDLSVKKPKAQTAASQ